MASYTVDANDVGVWWTMTASTADTVDFAANISRLLVINEGDVPVFVALDGSTPTVPAAGESTATMRVPGKMQRELSATAATDTVKLISSGTPTVAVEQVIG